MICGCAGTVGESPAQTGAAGGGAAGSTMPLTFSGQVAGSANYRPRLALEPDTGSATSTRLGLSLRWLLSSPRTSFYASVSPFYEWFDGEDTFTSAGATAGLGWVRRSTPRRTWRLSSTFEATPDQDTPRPETSVELSEPEVRLLVPRNGFVNTTLDGGVSQRVSERLQMSYNGSASSRRYNAYQVNTEGDVSDQLVDQVRLSAATSAGWSSTPLTTWSGSLAVSRTLLQGGQGTSAESEEDTRDQVQVGLSWNHRTGPRSLLRLGTGYSVLTTDSTSSSGLPTVDLAWELRGPRLSSSVTLRREQGIFPGSFISASGVGVAGRVSYRVAQRWSLYGFGGYAQAARASDVDGRTETINLAGGGIRSMGRLDWRAGFAYGRQDSDGGPGLDVETVRVLGGLAWRFTGAREAP